MCDLGAISARELGVHLGVTRPPTHAQVHRAVLAAGAKESGCTVHYVSEAVDGGEIVAQKRCDVCRAEATPACHVDTRFPTAQPAWSLAPGAA